MKSLIAALSPVKYFGDDDMFLYEKDILERKLFLKVMRKREEYGVPKIVDAEGRPWIRSIR